MTPDTVLAGPSINLPAIKRPGKTVAFAAGARNNAGIAEVHAPADEPG